MYCKFNVSLFTRCKFDNAIQQFNIYSAISHSGVVHALYFWRRRIVLSYARCETKIP